MIHDPPGSGTFKKSTTSHEGHPPQVLPKLAGKGVLDYAKVYQVMDGRSGGPIAFSWPRL